jgi:hypothetical protein
MAYKFQVGPARLSGSTVFEEAVTAASVTSVGASSAATLSASAGVSGGSLDIAGNADIDGELDVGGLFKMADVTSGKLLVADGTSYEEVAMSGDATLASSGALTIENLAVTNAKLAADAVDGTKLADDSVDSEHIVDGSIDLAHMSANSVDSDQYVDGSIDTAHIADNQVTLAKMAGLARGSVIIGDASGDPSALAKGAAHTFLQSDGTDTAYVAMSGDATLNAGALTIADNAVTLAKMAGLTRGSLILGDASGDPSALAKGTAAQFLQSDGTDPSYVSISGDATVAAGGALTIADDAVTPAKMSLFDDSLAATDTHILIADGSDYSSFAMSGDATLSNAGALTIAADAVESSMLNDNVISGQTELAAGDIADADELMISDGGSLKKVGVDSLATFIRGMAVQAIGDEAGTLTEGLNYGTANITADRAWTLPASPAVGDQVVVKAGPVGDGVAIVVTRAGSQLIDGSLQTVSLEEDGSSVTLVYAVADRWVIV